MSFASRNNICFWYSLEPGLNNLHALRAFSGPRLPLLAWQPASAPLQMEKRCGCALEAALDWNGLPACRAAMLAGLGFAEAVRPLGLACLAVALLAKRSVNFGAVEMLASLGFSDARGTLSWPCLIFVVELAMCVAWLAAGVDAFSGVLHSLILLWPRQTLDLVCRAAANVMLKRGAIAGLVVVFAFAWNFACGPNMTSWRTGLFLHSGLPAGFS